MDFEYFGLSRDLLYLSALFLGVAVAVFFISLRKDCSLRRKSALITVILCLATFVIAALAASIILSKGLILSVSLLYPFVVLFFVLGALALYFPRAGGYPVIFAVSLFAAYICFSFLKYPGLKEPERLIVRSSGAELVFRLDTETWEILNDQRMVRFEAVSITANPAYPIIGGERRGLITRVLRNDIELFALTRAFNLHSGVFLESSGFYRENFLLDLPIGALPPGISLSVLFSGDRFYFDPPIHL